MEIRISVRNLVEFLMRGGDLDNRHTAQADNAMQAGSRVHREIQKNMGPEYSAEVTLRITEQFDDYALTIEGRADGIIERERMEVQDGHTGPEREVIIDEIKGTYRDVQKLKEPAKVHLAQAKCYAYIYAKKEGLSEIGVRMTYVNLDTDTFRVQGNSEGIRYFYETYSFEELSLWYQALIEEYRKWSDYRIAWAKKRTESIEQLEFPFSYREGQKELVSYVYQTIYHKKKLFLEAPTGVGKTISTVFPAVKAVGKGMAERIFYLTAKTITRTVADETFAKLREGGLAFRSLILTAKEKICPMEETVCNPEACPYAKGHFDRINECLYDCMTHEESCNREIIEQYSEKYQVCPFEMSLDMSLFADAVICDYNYVFDPHVYLKRFFAEGASGENLFLIDEAHNLVERGRQMYSAQLCKEDFLELKRSIKGKVPYIESLLDKCNKELLALKRECDGYETDVRLGGFTLMLSRLGESMAKYLENTDASSGFQEEREAILEFYFEVSHFLMISELVDEHYVPYTQIEDDGRFVVKLFCVDPSVNMQECMARGRSSILFSATFLPIQYYKKLLGGLESDYEVYAGSTFNPAQKGLFLATDVTSKYTSRSRAEYERIAAYIRKIVDMRYGNYMVFFPSHQFLREVYDIFMEHEYDESYMECIVQESNMNESARETFLNRFTGNADYDLESSIAMEIEYDDDKCLIGFCVLGGMFSEGIDLKNDALIGAIIVGTGLPQVCPERTILKDYFDRERGNGFDYAYRYPGMNKVLQAAGRVIRTAEDIGVVALLDHRFLQPAYQQLFPREWEQFETVTQETVGKRVERFWNEWLYE